MPSLFAGSGLLSRQLGSIGSLASDMERFAANESSGWGSEPTGMFSTPSFTDTGLTSSLLSGQRELGGLTKESWFGGGAGANGLTKERGIDLLGGSKYGGSSGYLTGGAGAGVGQFTSGGLSTLNNYDSAFAAAGARYGIDPNWLKAIAAIEGHYDNSVDQYGAVGIMGIMPGGYQELQAAFPGWQSDPAQNIMLGAAILADKIRANGGTIEGGIQGYLGWGTDAYGTTPDSYLQRAQQYYQQLQQGGGQFSGGQQPINGQWGGNPVGNSFVQAAMQFVGVDYVWGSIPGANQNPWQTGWDCCLIGETRVYGPTIVKRIDEMVEGDVVWSFQDGKIIAASVTKAWQSKRQKVYEVHARGRTIVASANHPFLIARSVGRSTNARASFDWVRLDELKRGDQLVSFEHGLFTASTDTPDADLAWLLGLILGDGNVTDRHLNLCVYGDNAERAAEILIRLTGNTPLLDQKHGITIGCKAFCDDLRRWGFNRPAHEKRVPEIVWRFGNDEKRAFLDGYCAADGSKPRLPKYGERSYASCSKDLLADIRAIHLALGDAVGVISTNKRAKPITIKGKTVKNARPLYAFAVYHRGKRYVPYATSFRVRDAIADGDGRWMVRRVLSVTEVGEQDTWDIEVSGTGNFVAEGVVVHNSGFTYYMSQKYGDGSIPMGSHYQYQYAQQTGKLFTNLNQLQPGDLVFIDTGWQGGSGAELNRAGHVGIYIGNGQMIHAANPSQGTIISPLSGYGGIMGAMHQSGSGMGPVAPGMLAGGGGNPLKALLDRVRGM